MRDHEPLVNTPSGQSDDFSVDFHAMMRAVKIIPVAILGFCLAYTLMMMRFPGQIIYLELSAALLVLFFIIRYRVIQGFIWPILKIVFEALTAREDEEQKP